MNLHGIKIKYVLKLATSEKVNKQLVKQIIKQSAFWSHPSGNIVAAPNHYKNIWCKEDGLWKITFGSNTFAISKAVIKCQELLITLLDEANNNEVITLAEIKYLLANEVGECVESYQGYEYKNYRGFYNDYLEFGTQLISINNFVNFIINKCQTFEEIKPICPYCRTYFKHKLELKIHANSIHGRG